MGKTDLTLYLAEFMKSAVISGDAYQVYRHMDIGTAKPSASEMAKIKHYLINMLEPHVSYSVANFKREAEIIINSENKSGHIPILSGGTGLYVQALLEGYNFTDTVPDHSLRSELNAIFTTGGIEALKHHAEQMAMKEGLSLPFTDKHRLFRAIELMVKGDGAALAEQAKDGLRYDGPVIGLSRPREELYERINLRVDTMVETGLFKEVEHLRELNVDVDAQAMRAIGYKEVIPYLNGNISKIECIEAIKQNTRRFAKRQITWYKRMPYIQWIHIDKSTTKNDIQEQGIQIIKNHYDTI